MRFKRLFFYCPFHLAFFLLILHSVVALAQAPIANSDQNYLQLRNLKLGKEALLAENIVLEREFATFTFRNGTIFFAEPVNGKVTAAVFVGEGSLALKPDSAAEQKSLALLSKSSDFNERFEVVVLQFTDGTYDELVKAAPKARDLSAADRAAKALANNLEATHQNREVRYNVSARILQDVLATSPGGFFAAFVNGKNYSGKELFIVDPQGVTSWGLQPEEVAFVTYDENKFGIWAASHLRSELATGAAKGSQMNGPIDLISQKLDTTIQKNAEMKVSATTTILAVRDGIRVLPFSLFRNFKIDSVTDESGQPLAYIFEKVPWVRQDRDDPDNFNVILPTSLPKGSKFTLHVTYGGKEAVSNTGGGNYSPEAREDWFPATRIGDYADYEMTFRIPKGMTIAASGTQLSQKNEGDWNVTQWRTEAPISVTGFNFGRFKSTELKLNNGFIIQTCANTELPDSIRSIKQSFQGGLPEENVDGEERSALGTMDTTIKMKEKMAEAQLAMGLYTDYFGPLSYKRLAMTQQTACNYGQAWPGLVWLPICSFFDSTVKHQFGIDETRQPYWNVVAPHEIAHEWWGHTVGWASYRDQWMSEGFAQLSASLFVQAVYKDADKGLYNRIWQSQQRSLREKNQYGYRPIDVGPLTMGYRVNSTKVGDIYNTLIYDKGSFVLHMLRRMMWDPKTGDQRFKETMRDFVATYRDRPASTEDFKAVVEKHMSPIMDIDHNHKMDWFFDEWVYGTEFPKYDFTYNIENDSTGASISFKLVQSNVSPKFKMLVPLYFEMPDGKIVLLGSGTLTGNITLEQKLPLGKGNVPKRMMINYYNDVLSDN